MNKDPIAHINKHIMKKGTILLLGIIFFLSLTGAAQQRKVFYARFGGNIFLSGNKEKGPFFFPALSFAPGIRIAQSKDFALVLAAPLSIGSSNRSSGSSYLGFDVPATLELNVGAAAGNNEKSHFGLMIGAGAGYHYAGNYEDTYSNPYTDYRQFDFWGYRLESGLCFGKDEDGGRVMILFNYGRGFTADKKTVIGAGLLFTMGNIHFSGK